MVSRWPVLFFQVFFISEGIYPCVGLQRTNFDILLELRGKKTQGMMRNDVSEYSSTQLAIRWLGVEAVGLSTWIHYRSKGYEITTFAIWFHAR